MVLSKKLIFVLLVFLLPVAARSQNCYFDAEEKNADGKPMRVVGHELGDPVWNWKFFMERVADSMFVTVRIVQHGNVPTTLHKGHKVVLEMEDKKKIELTLDYEFPPMFYENVPDSLGCTIYIPKFTIDKNIMASLGKARIKKLSTTLGTKTLNLPGIAAWQGDKIVQSANCILKD